MSCGGVCGWVRKEGSLSVLYVLSLRSRCSTYLPSWDLLLFVLCGVVWCCASEGGCFGGGGGNVGLHGDLCVRYGTEY